MKKFICGILIAMFCHGCAIQMYSDDPRTRWDQMGYKCELVTLHLVNKTNKPVEFLIDGEIHTVTPAKKWFRWKRKVTIRIQPGLHKFKAVGDSKTASLLPCHEYTLTV